MSKVLIIEDEHQLRENIVELFESQGYEVIMAENGTEGLSKALMYLPDLIVSDVIMPEEDGFMLLQRLRKNAATEFIPVIFLTAKTMFEAKMEGLRLGADDYLMKPFSGEELLVRASNLIARNRRLIQKGMISVHTENIQPKNEKFVRDLVAYLEENLANFHLSVDMVAAHMKLSKSTIQRKLKQAVNKNLNQLIREYRLEKARVMIDKDAGTLSQIAEATGFNSLSYFSYSYKQFYGHAPSRINK
jgi:DNA-binding response OmpR family regulator